MSSATAQRFQDLLHDIKNSWYFRVWLLVWIIMAITAFVGFIILANTSRTDTAQLVSKISLIEKSSMHLPRFHFHTAYPPYEEGTEIITNISCRYHERSVPTGQCQSSEGVTPDIYHCEAVYGDLIEVINSGHHLEMGIHCNITTSGNLSQIGNMIAWGMEGGRNIIAGPDSHTSVWLHPTQNVAIFLSKGIISSKDLILWERQVTYLSSVTTPSNFYSVRIIVDGFDELDFSTQNLYNGWRASGDIGGVAFFVVVLHTMVMILIGCVLTNDSIFVKKPTQSTNAGNSIHTYAPIAEKS